MSLNEVHGPESFTDSLVPTSYDARSVQIWGIKNEPEVLARERTIAEGEDSKALLQSIKESETLFAQMRDAYGIRVVSMNSRSEKNREGKMAIFTLVDKIDGQNVSDIKAFPTNAKDKLENLYFSLIQYYRDCWMKNVKYWGESRSDQFVYGHKHGESNDDFFLVDVDPQFYSKGDDEFHTIAWCLNAICDDLMANEEKFTPVMRLQNARSALLNLIQEMLTEEADSKPLLASQTLLKKAA